MEERARRELVRSRRLRRQRKTRYECVLTRLMAVGLSMSALAFAIAVIAASIEEQPDQTRENTYCVETMQAQEQCDPAKKIDVSTIDEYETTPYTEKDVELLAKVTYGEALVTKSDTEMSAVMWCVLNRVDCDGYACGGGIEYVVTYPHQFTGYDPSNPVTEHLEWLAKDVLDRWYAEKEGNIDVGRTLPPDYMWFDGDGSHNTFRNDYDRKTADYWDWELGSPYES